MGPARPRPGRRACPARRRAAGGGERRRGRPASGRRAGAPTSGSRSNVRRTAVSLVSRFNHMTKENTTRDQIVDAAMAALAEDGFAGATSRAIARRGKFNQALVYYYFGSLDALLLAALDKTSEERLGRYRKAVEGASTLEELMAVAARAYRDDRKSHHVAVVSQMVAGSVTRPDLAPAVLQRMEPWVDLSRDALRKAARLAGLEELV